MPVSADIYGQIAQPQPTNLLKNYADVIAIQNAQQQNQLGATKLDEYQRSIDRQNKLQQLLSQQYGDPTEREGALLRGGYVDESLKLGKDRREGAKLDNESLKAKNEAEAAQFKLAHDRTNAFLNIVSSAVDEPSYQRALAMSKQLGLDVSLAPAQFDPQFVKSQGDAAQTMKDRIEAAAKIRGLDLEEKKNNETARHNTRTEALTAQGQQIQIRGQNLTDARARERFAFEQGTAVADAGGPGQAMLSKQFGKAPPGFRWKGDGSLEQIPGGPADRKATEQQAGKETVDSVVASLRQSYDALESGGGITSTEKGPGSNITAAISSSGIGQKVGGALGTRNQKERDNIAEARPLLLQAIMKATGMSAKQMDSNAELKLYLATATDPQLSLEANRQALKRIEDLYGSGSTGKLSPPTPPAPSPAPSGEPARVASDADYAKLPSGAMFIGPDGKTRRKP